MDKTMALLGVSTDHAADDLAALIRAAQANPVAFGALYDLFVGRVYAYLRARTAGPDEAGDLTQQVFLQALDALPRYRGGGGAFAAWLFRIARNTSSNVRSRRRHTVALHLVPEGSQPEAGGDPEAAALRHEATAHLRTLLAALPAEKREVLALRFAAGLAVADIAAVIGKSEAATRKQLARTLHTLQEHYHEGS
jgi:RNA polymerase sigma-70 factor (ECF subfamily)